MAKETKADLKYRAIVEQLVAQQLVHLTVALKKVGSKVRVQFITLEPENKNV